MTKFKKIAALLALLAMTEPAVAALQTRKRIPLVVSKTDTATYTYCVMNGQDSSSVGAWKKAPQGDKVITAGASNAASTTVSEATDTDPFFPVAAGDLLRFDGDKPGTDPERVLVTHTSDSSVVLNRAIDLDPDTPKNASETSGFSFSYKNRSCSTTLSAGLYVPLFSWETGNFLLMVESESSATSGADYKLVCYVEGASAATTIVASGNVTQAQASAGQAVAIGSFDLGTFGFSHCALAVKSDAGSVVYSAYLIVKEIE